MSSPFEALLIDAARAAEKAAGAAESTLRRVEQVSRDMFELSQRVAALESASATKKEWDGVERRELKERLGSGDHTFQKLQTELELMKQEAEAHAKEVTSIKKSLLRREERQADMVEKKESRKHAILMLVLKYTVPALVSGIGAAAGYYFMAVAKGGPP